MWLSSYSSLAVLLAAGFFNAAAWAGEGNDLGQARQRLQWMLKIGNPDQSAPAPDPAALGREIIRLENRLADRFGPVDWNSLAKRHRGAGPCLRYGSFVPLAPPQLAALVRDYGRPFLEENLSALGHRAGERERAAHLQAPQQEYLEWIRQTAARRFESGEAAYWVALAERRQELLEEIGQAAPPPPVPAELAAALDRLLNAYPALADGETRLALLYFLEEQKTQERGRRLAKALQAHPSSTCAAPPDPVAETTAEDDRLDGWGRPFVLETKKPGPGCWIISYGKDGVPGGRGADADQRF